jgi:hypothetical protein
MKRPLAGDRKAPAPGSTDRQSQPNEKTATSANKSAISAEWLINRLGVLFDVFQSFTRVISSGFGFFHVRFCLRFLGTAGFIGTHILYNQNSDDQQYDCKPD